MHAFAGKRRQRDGAPLDPLFTTDGIEVVMKTIKYLPLFLILLSVAACGGGSEATTPDGTTAGDVTGDPTGNPGGDPSADDPAALRTKAILADCLPTLLDETSGWAQLVKALFEGNASALGIAIPPGGIELVEEPDMSSLAIQWELNPGGDRPLGGGHIWFVDAEGMPTQPFPQPALDLLVGDGLPGTEDIDALGAALPSIAEDTHVLVEFDGPEWTLRIGSLDVLFVHGQPQATSGSAFLATPGCEVEVRWTGVDFSALDTDYATDFPSGVWELSVTAGEDMVLGTLTFDGTRTATASVSLNGAASTAWDIDLVSATVTPQ